MKIYTKKGDNGTTSTLGGSKLPKHHLKIEAYGTVDELNSTIGWLRDQEVGQKVIEALIKTQNNLFSIGSHLAADQGKTDQRLPELNEYFIKELEERIDHMEESLPPMKNFILPGGHTTVSTCHIVRTICRRAERRVSQLAEIEELDPVIVPYLNRLSDYFFVLSRKLSSDLGAKEIPWLPKK